MTGQSDQGATDRWIDEVLGRTPIPGPTWTATGDLSRMSIEAFAARESFGPGRSFGALRLFGDGVRGHAASLDVVGAICQEFQRIVTSTGAALEGSTSTRGRISEGIVQRARLVLEASPMPGSLVLALTPDAAPEEELHDRRNFSVLQDDPEPLVDRSIRAVLRVIEKVSSDSALDAPDLAAALAELGPRAVQAISAFAKSLSKASFDLDLDWSQAGQPRQRATLTSEQAGWLQRFVAARKLDESPVELVGVLRTVSNRRAIELEIQSEGVVSLKLGQIDPTTLAQFHVDQRVRATALETVEFKVGGGEVRSLVLSTIEPE